MRNGRISPAHAREQRQGSVHRVSGCAARGGETQNLSRGRQPARASRETSERVAGRQGRPHRTGVSATLRARIEPRRIPQPRLQDRLAKQRGQPRCRRTPGQSHRLHAKPPLFSCPLGLSTGLIRDHFVKASSAIRPLSTCHSASTPSRYGYLRRAEGSLIAGAPYRCWDKVRGLRRAHCRIRTAAYGMAYSTRWESASRKLVIAWGDGKSLNGRPQIQPLPLFRRADWPHRTSSTGLGQPPKAAVCARHRHPVGLRKAGSRVICFVDGVTLLRKILRRRAGRCGRCRSPSSSRSSRPTSSPHPC